MRKGILLLFFGLVLSAPSWAQETQDTTKISLQEAIDLALENNYQLQQASNNLEVANEEVFQAKAEFFPSLNASMSGSQTTGQQFNNIQLSYVEQTSNNINGDVRVSITVFDGFNNILNLKRSRANKQSEEQSYERTRETIIFNAASGYLQVLLDKKLLEIGKQNLEASRQQLEQVKAQVEVGSRPTVDLYNQESIVANNELQVIQRENAVEISKTRLIRILQLDPLKNYDLLTPDLNKDDISTQEYTLGSLTKNALENRKDLEAQKLLIKAQEYNYKMSKGNLYPSISASAGLSTLYQDTYRGFDSQGNRISVDFSDQFFDQRVTRFAGFSIDIPIFNNWTTRLNIQQAKVNYKNAQLNLEDMKYGVQEEVKQAYNDYVSYKKQLESTQKALRAAEKTYETQQQRYNVGASTLIELSDANANYVQAQSDNARALYNLIFQEKLLDFYIGKLDQNISLN